MVKFEVLFGVVQGCQMQVVHLKGLRRELARLQLEQAADRRHQGVLRIVSRLTISLYK